MKATLAILTALALAGLGLALGAAPAEAARCIVGSDGDCIVHIDCIRECCPPDEWCCWPECNPP
jgi:hypothetical protein